VRYPGVVRGLGGAAVGVLSSVRRRRQGVGPRVRVRTGHGEARVLPDESPNRRRVLSLAAELVEAYGNRGARRVGDG
jgi:hypothetical protein